MRREKIYLYGLIVIPFFRKKGGNFSFGSGCILLPAFPQEEISFIFFRPSIVISYLLNIHIHKKGKFVIRQYGRFVNYNKDDNIHKSGAEKTDKQTNIKI